MNVHLLYAVVAIASDDAATLQLRTDMEWLDDPKLVLNDRREWVLQIPAPSITVATGTPAELLQLCHTMFGTPLSDATPFDHWRRCDDGLWTLIK